MKALGCCARGIGALREWLALKEGGGGSEPRTEAVGEGREGGKCKIFTREIGLAQADIDVSFTGVFSELQEGLLAF